MIELIDVHKRLGDRQILDGMTFEGPNGLNYVLMGPSGTGKSVTLKHVIGILRPDSGTVRVDGKDVPAMSHGELMALRKRMGYLFQNGALINWLTVFDNVALPLREQFPPSISGGMKLRAGLARALVTKPEYVLYDEPNAGLDPIISQQIHELIAEVRDTLHVTGLVVTHSRACATQCGDRIGVIEDGRIAVEGTIDEMVQSDNELAAAFLGVGSD